MANRGKIQDLMTSEKDQNRQRINAALERGQAVIEDAEKAKQGVIGKC